MKTAIEFNQKGLFEASHAAEKWLDDRGFSYGPSQADGPQAIWFGDCDISKWRNLSRKERAECHATMAGNHREGPMRINLMPGAPDEAMAAFNLEVVAA